MALFVEVESIEKSCTVIINLEEVMEIAPLVAGGCDLFFPDAAAVSGKRAMRVKDDYSLFRQFAIQPVSAEQIAKVNNRSVNNRSSKSITKETIEIPTLGVK
jgi:hypothetical protein